MKELGTIKRLGAREAWDTEDRDFTPWLEKNIELLASVLGRDIEIEEREAAVGPFSADLMGRDIDSQSVVVIENQFGTTNHDHLGKVLTYASGRDASVVVWIAEEFRDEHRSVMDWLNDKTGEDTAFFAIELEVLQIGDSKPAPNFKLVASPNWWKRGTKEEPSLSPRQKAYREFWADFLGRLKERAPELVGRRTARPVRGFCMPARGSLGLAVPGLRYCIDFTPGATFVVTLDIATRDREKNKEALEDLRAEKQMIEREVGVELLWVEPTGRRKFARICIEQSGSISDPPEQLEDLKKWGIDMALKFRAAFSERIRALEL